MVSYVLINIALFRDPNSPGAEPDYENDKGSNIWNMYDPIKQQYLSVGKYKPSRIQTVWFVVAYEKNGPQMRNLPFKFLYSLKVIPTINYTDHFIIYIF